MTKPAGKHRRSTSPLNHQHAKSVEETLSTEPLMLHNVPALQDLKARFLREIQTPIDLQTSVHKAKTPQRCLQHNNVITLYCVNDCQALCVTCMYQNNTHKRHKVIPLNRSGKELKAELDNSLKSVESAVTKADAIEADSIRNLEQAQKEFPDIIRNIDEFYGGLIRMLEEKRDEQVRHVEDTWMRLKHQYASWGQEMEKLKVYVMERVGELYERPGQQNLLFNRNIAANLSVLNKIIHADMCPYHATTYMEEVKRFKEARHQLEKRLIFTSPFEIKVDRKSIRKQKTTLKARTQSFTRPSEPVFMQRIAGKPSVHQTKIVNKVSQTLKSIEKQKKMQQLSPRPAYRRAQPSTSAHKSPSRSRSQVNRIKLR